MDGKKLTNITTALTEASPSVQSHLGILQGVISRMASNSSQCKAWCITLISAILVVIAGKENPKLIWIALFPTVLFMFLDIYYLTLENAFRDSYNKFVAKVHTQTLMPDDLYSVVPTGNMFAHRRKALSSFSIWGFYIGVSILIFLARYVVLN